MKTPNSDNFAEYFAFFGRHFSLEARLPEHVIKSTRDHKFVIGESGDLHGVEIFERLGAIYGDRELNYLMIEPEAEGIFMAETRLLAYSLPFGANFRSNWNVELRGFSQGDECALITRSIGKTIRLR